MRTGCFAAVLCRPILIAISIGKQPAHWEVMSVPERHCLRVSAPDFGFWNT